MKKLIIILAVVMIGFTVSCGEKKADGAAVAEPENSGPKVAIKQFELFELPGWYYDEDIEIKKSGDEKAYIYFKLHRDALDPQTARSLADDSVRTIIAAAISQITHTQMAKANKDMLNEAGEMDEYFLQPISTISRGVDISGIIPGGRVIEYIQRQLPDAEPERFYRVTDRYSMEYQTFVDRLMSEVSKQAPGINERLKEKGLQILDEVKMRENMMELAQ